MSWYIKESRMMPIILSFWRRNCVGPASVSCVLAILDMESQPYAAFKKLCRQRVVTTERVTEALKEWLESNPGGVCQFDDGSKLVLSHLMDEVFVVE